MRGNPLPRLRAPLQRVRENAAVLRLRSPLRVCDDPLCSDCEYRCEDCDCALCYECVYDFADDYAYCSDCWNSRRQEPYYADSPCWLKMQEHKHMLTIGLEIETMRC